MPSRSPSLEELKAEKEHLRLALDAGEIGTWEWDLASDRMKWSAQMFRSLGLAPGAGDDLFHALIDAVHPADQEYAQSAFAGFRTRPGPVRLEVRVVWPKGDTRWLVFLGKTVADKDGVPTRMLGITIDSTRRRETEEAAEAALRDSESRLLDLTN